MSKDSKKSRTSKLKQDKKSILKLLQGRAINKQQAAALLNK